MAAVASPHDKFVRAILSDKNVAIDYFKSCLPVNILDLLDLSTLTQLSDTYVSKELRETISDIVYSCRAKDGERDLKISLLLEHKSRPEKFTPVQLAGYIFSGFQKQITNDKRLSPIVPVLLYHGREKWVYKTLTGLLEGIPAELCPFVPEYEYIYHDLGEITDEQIEQLENGFLRASLLVLKYSQLKAELMKWIPTILSLPVDASANLQTQLFVYTFEIGELEEEQIIELIDRVPDNLKSKVMSTADIFVEKGKKIGLEEGDKRKTEKIVRNLVKLSGLTDEQIAGVAEVEVTYVSRIRKELVGGK